MARSAWLGLALVVAALSPVASVQESDLEKFFSSAQGLAMSSKDAADLASKEADTLSACGVTVPMLQALKDAMYSTSMLDMTISEIRQNLLPLAYQHVSPADLNTLFQTLYSTRSVDLPRGDAVAKAMQLGKQKAEPYLLGPLYQVLYSVSAVNLLKADAQKQAVELTAAGASAEQLKASYMDARSKMGKDAALTTAIKDAVVANLYGLETRYAKDGKPYVAKDFQSYYGEQWLAEWIAGPQEKRTAQDGKDYLASEFFAFYGPTWNTKWAASNVAVLRRIARDGKTYTMEEFQKYYGDTWQDEWAQSYEVLDICAGLNHATCDAQPSKCQWSWTGDWTTSCVVRPLQATSSILV